MFACFVVVAGSRSLLLWLVYLIFGFDCVGFFPCCRCRLVRFSLPVRDAPTKPTQLNVTHSENTHLFRFFQNNVQKNTKYLMMMMMIWFSSRLWFWIVRSIFTLFVFNASEHFDTSHTQNSLSLLFSIVTFQTECILIQIHTFGIQRTLSS